MVRLEIREKLNLANPKSMRGITPLAQCDGGVLCAVNQGWDADEDAAAIELVGDRDAFDPLPEHDWTLPFHVYAVCASGGGKSTYLGRLADRFREMTGGTVICFSAEEGDDPAIAADARISVGRCAELTLDDLAGDVDEETGVPERVLVLWDDHLSGLDKHTLDSVLRLQRACIQLGRKRGVCSATSAHKAACGRESSHVLTGMTHLAVWPHHGASKNIKRVLEVYAGQPPDLLNLLRKDPAWGRCCTLRLSAPAAVIGSRRAMLLNRPELIEGLAKGERLRIVKSVQETSAEAAESGGESDPESAAAALRAVRRRRREARA